MEQGTRDFTFIGLEQAEEGPIGIKFTDNQQTLGALRFSVFLNEQIFNIESVVDATCRQVEELSVEGRLGETQVLQNWDVLYIKFGSQTYVLRLGISRGLKVQFTRFIP